MYRDNRYNPYTQSYLAPIQGANMIYEPVYDPNETQRLANLLEQRQKRYDFGKQQFAEAQSQIGGIQTYAPDLLNKQLGQFSESVQNVVNEQYGGDWGLAANDVVSMIAKERARPEYKFIAEQNKQAELQKQLMAKYGDKAIVGQNIASSQALQDALAAGDLSMLQTAVYERPDYSKEALTYAKQIAPNISQELFAELGITDQKRIEELSEMAQLNPEMFYRKISYESPNKNLDAAINPIANMLYDSNKKVLKAEYPDLSPEEIKNKLKKTVADATGILKYSKESEQAGNFGEFINQKSGSESDNGLTYQPTISGDKFTSTKYTDWLKSYIKSNESNNLGELENYYELDDKILLNEVDKIKSIKKSLESLNEGNINDVDQNILDESQLKIYLKLKDLSNKTALNSLGKSIQLIKNPDSKEHKEYYNSIVDLQKSLNKSISKNKPKSEAINFYNANKEIINEFKSYRELYPLAFEGRDFNSQLAIFANLRDKEGTYTNQILTYGNDDTFRNKVKNTISGEGTFESAYVRNPSTYEYELIKPSESNNYTSIDTPGKIGDKNLNIKEDYNYKGIDSSDGSIELEAKDDPGRKVHVYPTDDLAKAGQAYKDVTKIVNANKVADESVFMNVFGNTPGFTTISMKIYDPYENRVISKTVPIKISKLREMQYRKNNEIIIDRNAAYKHVTNILNNAQDWSSYNTSNVRGQSIKNNFEKGFVNKKFE